MKTSQLASALAAVLLIGCRSTPDPAPPVVTMPADDMAPRSIIVRGNVKYPVIPWTQDMTVAKAILEADYLSARDPLTIIIRRHGDRIFVSPTRLMHGTTNPWLEPGDILEIHSASVVQAVSLLGKYDPPHFTPDIAEDQP
jgi:hypothetical protein